MSFPFVEAVLLRMANAVKEQYIANLQANKRPTVGFSEWMASHYPGKLADSITTEVTIGDGKFVASLNLNKYWKYVESGVGPKGKYGNPGWKAYPAILDWVTIKPVIPRPDSNGRIPKPSQLAYLITRSVALNGTSGTHDLQMAKDAVIPTFMDSLERALRADVGNIVLKFMRW